jgi:hypothetical protein
MRDSFHAPVTLTFLGAHFYTYMEDAFLHTKCIPKRARITSRNREGLAHVKTPQIAEKIAPALFLLWLVLVNLYYYAQFREMALSRLPWLAPLWPRLWR